jgi:CheY-like chemotaxis protein
MAQGVLEVLLVEDNVADAEMIKHILEETRVAHHVSSAKNGEEALRYLNEAHRSPLIKPDLIVLDMNMPRMNGDEFLERAKALLGGVYVVVISGSPEMVIGDIPHCKMVKPGTGSEIDEVVSMFSKVMNQLLSKK